MKIKTAIISGNVLKIKTPEDVNEYVCGATNHLIKKITKHNSDEESDGYNVVRSVSVFSYNDAIHIIVGYTEEVAGG